MVRTITVRQLGYLIKGEAELNLWGGGQGSISMKPVIIPELTTKRVLEAINDNGFGCESFAGAEVDMYRLYEKGVTEYIQSESFTQDDLWGNTNKNADFDKLAKDYEANVKVIKDRGDENEV